MLEINKKNARIWSMLGMRRVLGMMLDELIKTNDNFFFVTADVARYFGTESFEEAYPEHYVDVGIAEQNMVTVAAGLQKEGMDALAATYATFTTARTMDQVRVSLGYMQLPVVLVGVGGGLAEGDLSATHMGLEDVAMLRAVPNIRIIEPADCVEFIKVLYATNDHKYPTYIRLTGKTNLPRIYKDDYDFEIGKAVKLRDGDGEYAVLSAGVVTDTVLKAVDDIRDDRGMSIEVFDMHTLKPLDEDLLKNLSGYKCVFVAEEHMRIGGLGSAVSEFFADKAERPRVCIIGIDDYYPDANDYEELLKECGLDVNGIIGTISSYLE